MNAIGSMVFGVRSIHVMVFVTFVEQAPLPKRVGQKQPLI
jgi:hypothetical protein|tara:strand:- start:497 stop:616 length:120 start_codon:yes stop_codon:yes gene_type:complete